MHIYVQSVNNNPGERIIGQVAPSLGTPRHGSGLLRGHHKSPSADPVSRMLICHPDHSLPIEAAVAEGETSQLDRLSAPPTSHWLHFRFIMLKR